MRDLLLAIETSCDETAAAVLNKKTGEVLASVVKTQWIHSEYGGVVPELASREHIRYLMPIIDETFYKAGANYNDIGAVAAAYGPGLVGALLVGVSTAKSLSYAWNVPFIPVNHLEGHIFANFYNPDESQKLKPNLPAVVLIVSGGHTLLLYVEKLGEYKLIGQTRDDAAGEVFDKVAKFMKIGYPGGYMIDKLSKDGNPRFERFPRAKIKKDKGFDFSFSGLKTAVIYYLNKKSPDFIEEHKPDIAASFQEAVVDVLVDKSVKAAELFNAENVYISGGVARNSRLRYKMERKTKKKNINFYTPVPELCTDNAVMIGLAGLYHWEHRHFGNLSVNAVPNLKIFKESAL